MPNQFPALEAFISKGSVCDIQSAPVAVIKEVQAILNLTVDGIAGTQTLYAFAKFKACEHQEQPSLLGAGSAKLLIASVTKLSSSSPKEGGVKLPVPHYYQIDNDTDYHGSGYRQCNLTSHAMALAYLQPEFVKKSKSLGYDEPESYYGEKLNRYGDTTDHNAHTQCLQHEFGIQSSWTTSLDKATIIKQLDSGFPVPAGVIYKGSGHIVLIVGHTSEGFLIHDPYGTRHGANDSYDVGVGGVYDLYSWSLLNQVYFDSPGESGWGRVFR